MDVSQLLTILWRRKGVILLATTMAVFIAILITLGMPLRYVASTTLRISTAQIGTVLDQRGFDLSYSDRLMNTYSKLATSAPILAQLNQKLGVTKAPAVSIDIPANTELMKISVEDGDPTLAANGANLLAQILIGDFNAHYGQMNKTADQLLAGQLAQSQSELDQARKNYEAVVRTNANPAQIDAARQALDVQEQAHNQLLTQYQQARLQEADTNNTIAVVDPATPPSFPSRPNVLINLGLGLAAGLVGGLGLGFLFETKDTTLFTTEQIVQATQATPVGWIPKSTGRRQGVIFGEHSTEAESMRRLRTNLVHQDHAAVPCTVLITSAESGEGKSTLTANLAHTLAQTGRGIMLVDADLRMPVMHRLFNVPNTQGLSTILERKASPNEVMHYKRNSGIWVIPSGPIPPNPAELLGSSEMQNLLHLLVERFDMVLIDVPPFLPVADAAILAPTVDQVLLVVARTIAHREAVRAAYDQLRELQVPSLGVVVNRAERGTSYSFYNYKPLNHSR